MVASGPLFSPKNCQFAGKIRWPDEFCKRLDELLSFFSKNGRVPVTEGRSLRTHLETNEFENFGNELKACFASFPYQWPATGNLVRYEAWYASLLHRSFRAIGLEVRSEESSSHGRADMVIEIDDQIFVAEFKMTDYTDQASEVEVATATEVALKSAFQQMRERG